MGWELLQAPPLGPFDVRVRYSDSTGGKRSDTFHVDVSELEGLSLNRPPDVDLVEAVKEISKQLGKWSTERLRVETMTVQERERQNAARAKEMQEKIAARKAGQEI